MEEKDNVKLIPEQEAPKAQLSKEEPGFLNEFLWTCSGVNKRILRNCPPEWAKYAGIGGTILFTALMASISGGYALSTVFDSPVVSVVFGIFWGLLIFNLDRFIVNTMYSDGKVTISWLELKAGLPRIIMAVFLGIVISTPLELKLFEKGIGIKIEDMKAKKLKELLQKDKAELAEKEEARDATLNRKLGNAEATSAVAAASSIGKALSELEGKMAAVEVAYNNARETLRTIDYEEDPGRYRKYKDLLASKRGELKRLRSEYERLQGQLASSDADYRRNIKESAEQRNKDLAKLDSLIQDLRGRIDRAEQEYAPQLEDEFDGLHGRLLAFEMLKNESQTTRIAALFVLLLFVIIETAPVFFKMMMASGPYDDMLRAEMHSIKLQAERRIADINADIDTSIKLKVTELDAKLQQELKSSEIVRKAVSEAQEELAVEAVRQWKEKELSRIKANPMEYIQGNIN